MGLVDSKDVKWQETDEKELEKQVAALKVNDSHQKAIRVQ